MTSFDMNRPPMKQKWYLMPLIWGGSWLMTRQFGLKIHKKNMENFKPPYLVISTHQGFSDYYITPLALFPHRANYVSDMEGFAAFGEWLYRAIGCIGKRRYVSDISVVKNMKQALDGGQSVVVYPESRHCNVGTTSYIPPNMGKLVKMMKVPLVVLTAHGSYLANPFWDEEHTRRVPMEATLEGVYTAEEVAKLSAEQIQQTIEEKLQYDEYAWQQAKGIVISDKNRAQGLHKALYQCRACGEEFTMKSSGSMLWCEKCGKQWELTEQGCLQSVGAKATGQEMLQDAEAKATRQEKVQGMEAEPAGQEILQSGEAAQNDTSIHIPDWYEWQRENVEREAEQGDFKLTFRGRVEALPNAKGFVELGEGVLTMDEQGFVLELAGMQEFSEERKASDVRNTAGKVDAVDTRKAIDVRRQTNRLVFPHHTRESVQTEYNYRGKGMAIVLSTKDCCYYIYSDDKHFNPTKLQFVGEYFYPRG